MSEEKMCPECERPIYGRADKKFCSDACRNAYNNKAYAGDRELIRKINLQLQKNRRILDEFYATGNQLVFRDDVLRQGFDFRYHTHTISHATHGTLTCAYDHAYLVQSDGYVKILKTDAL